jgi:hypothetical protein
LIWVLMHSICKLYLDINFRRVTFGKTPVLLRMGRRNTRQCCYKTHEECINREAVPEVKKVKNYSRRQS